MNEQTEDDFRIDILKRIISILKEDEDIKDELITKSYLNSLQEKVNFYNIGVQKGRLEQKKEELEFLLDLNLHYTNYIENNVVSERIKELDKEIEQLKKEIRGIK